MANYSSNNVSVIDTTTYMVVGTIPVGEGPGAIAITPDGTMAFVTNENSHSVSVIDISTNMLAGSTDAVGDGPIGIAITPDGKSAYVTNNSSNNVSVIDTLTFSVVETIAVGMQPMGILITPDGKSAYVATLVDVSVIDTATNMVVGSPISVPNGPEAIAITSDGKSIYVAVRNDTVSIIDTTTNKVVGSPIAVGSTPGFPMALAITPEDDLLGDPEPPMGDGNGSSSNSCALASPGASQSIPLYLLIPAFILIRRGLRRRTN